MLNLKYFGMIICSIFYHLWIYTICISTQWK